MAPFYAPGKYFCKVVDQGWQKSKNQNNMLVLTVRVNNGLEEFYDGAGHPQRHLTNLAAQYDRTIRLTFTENSAEMVVKKLRHAGFAGERFADVNLIGSEVEAVCSENGEYEQWDLALPALSSSPIVTDANVPRSLDALFGKVLRQSPVDATRPAPPPPTTTATTPDYDDDIPF